VSFTFSFSLSATAQPMPWALSLTWDPAVLFTVDTNTTAGTMQPGDIREVQLAFSCAAPVGATTIQVNVTINPTLILKFYLQKPCDYPMVNAGTADLIPDLLLNNADVRSFIAATSDESTDLFVWLDPRFPQDAWELPYTVSTEPDGANDLPVTVIQMGDWIARAPPTPTHGFTRLVWNCPPPLEGPDVENHVHLRFHLAGWTYNQYLHASLFKICPGLSSSSGGWSTAGIVFFILFLLVVTFFIAGSAYNYVQNQKRGWDVIPFMDYFRGCGNWCRERCCGARVSREGPAYANVDQKASVGPSHGVTPQEHEDGKRGYGSYQTDL